MKIFVAGLSYKTAPVEVREKLAVRSSRLPCYGCRLKLAAGLEEVVLVSTCNRVEVYGATAAWVQGKVFRIFQQLCPGLDVTPYLYVKEDSAAVEHLFSVAGGLDSMVIGETEITGQVKNAYHAAQQAGLTGLQAAFDAEPLPDRLEPVIETACFRVAQEALTNVVRHASARRVAVTLHQADGRLHLVVRDDGVGFDVEALRQQAVQGASLGLLSMEERATLVEGCLQLKSAPGEGTEVHAWFPLKWRAPQD